MKKELLAIFSIFIVSAVLSWPLTKPGLYQIHDDQQTARLFLFDKALREGQFPVRWVDELGFGYGYPLFVFYPPLVYGLGEIFHFLGFGFIDSVKIVFFLGIFASGLAMYVFAKELWGRLPAMISAFFYMMIPYRAIDVYIRGALAESFAFVWLPLILWSFLKIQQTLKFRYVLYAAAFLAFLMITHNLIFLPFMLLLPFYLLFLIINSPNKKLATSYQLLATILAFALSAFFWLPALLEKKHTIVDNLLIVSLANYNIHFVYPQQLWNWAWGFGGSAEGLADGISFKIGKLHVLISIVTLILAVIYLLIKRAKNSLSIVNCQLTIVFFLLFAFSAFMTTSYSKFIWDRIPPLGYLQFPWRFLTFTALFSSSLAGAFVYLLKVPIVKMVAAAVLIFLLFIPNLKLFKPQTYRFYLTDEKATAADVINWDISFSSFEYLPKGIELYRGPLGTNLVNIDKTDIPSQKIEVFRGQAEIKTQEAKSHRLILTADSENQAKLQANIFNFPGWQVRVNNQNVPIVDNNRLKLITFSLPSGNDRVNIEFKNTPARTIANIISLAAFVSVILIVFSRWRKVKH